ncbi:MULTISPECIES: hypothetical protein [Amycolatopsis]|uniref:Uncharacterized protein n=1 Tax=Amycolatopsis bullii TaxID=941987 RepID=A0ABQ3KQV7_9PSEU|nr:hypothetical protein [Amycolatopsis bullii]GHG45950.1 hypothetical protein GCM10017567_80650 [Amycolatopsis bullii]
MAVKVGSAGWWSLLPDGWADPLLSAALDERGHWYQAGAVEVPMVGSSA